MNNETHFKLFFNELKNKDSSFSIRISSKLIEDLSAFAQQRNLTAHTFIRLCLITKLAGETSNDIFELPARYQSGELLRPIAIKINSSLLSEIHKFITSEDIIFSDFVKSAIIEGFKHYRTWE